MKIPRIFSTPRHVKFDLDVVLVVVLAAIAMSRQLPFVSALAAPQGLAEPLISSVRMFRFCAAHVSAGELPLWNPYVFLGYPFLALGLGGVFYPPVWAYSFDDVATVIRLDLAGHAVLASIFAYALGRDLFKSRVAAFFVALAAVYMPAAAAVFGEQHISVAHAAAYLPLALLTCRHTLASGRPAWGLALAIVLGIQSLTGAFQYLLFEFAGLALYAIVDLARRYFAEWQPLRPVVRSGVLTLLFAFLGLALAGAQFVPSAGLLRESLSSQAATIKLVDSASVAVFPFNFLHIAKESGEPNTIFIGGPFLFALAFFGFFSTANREKWVFLIVAVQGLVYLRGEYFWLHQTLFPLAFFDASQSAAQIASIANLFVVLLAGFGIDTLFDRQTGKEPEWRRAWPLLLALTSILIVGVASVGPTYDAGILVAVSLAAVGVLVVMTRNIAPSGLLMLWLAGCLLLDTRTDLVPPPLNGAPDPLYLAGGEFEEIAKLHEGTDRVALVADATDTSHLEAGTPSLERTFPLYSGRGFRYAAQLRAYPLQAPISASEFTLLQAILRYFELLNIGYVVAPRPGSPFLDSVSASGKLYLKQELPHSVVYKSTSVMPMAFIVHRLQLRDRSVPFFRTLSSKDMEASKTVLVDQALDTSTFREPAGIEGIRVERYSEREVEFALSVAAPGVLVFSDAYYPGWRATVNDTIPREVFPADENLRGIQVEPGDKKVVFRFDPPAVGRGLIVTGAAAALWILLALSLIIFHRFYTRPIEAGPPPDAQGAPSP